MGVDGVIAALGGAGPRLAHMAADFADPAAPAAVIRRGVEEFGGVDVLVANHARGSRQSLAEVTAEELDLCWAVNARASLLLTQAYAAAHDDARPGGRVILFTSGQHLGPMSDELPYAISKGAIHQMTLSLSDALADRGITVNAVNPGPVDTGWAGADLTARLVKALPAGRWGRPEDAARLVRWLASDDSAWITPARSSTAKAASAAGRSDDPYRSPTYPQNIVLLQSLYGSIHAHRVTAEQAHDHGGRHYDAGPKHRFRGAALRARDVRRPAKGAHRYDDNEQARGSAQPPAGTPHRSERDQSAAQQRRGPAH
jgi:3-oxoacyl-[acyl-carrier protein] reductase